jgi:ABC-type transport system involved in multi-copper enzyme maturation permease subunit
MNLRWGLGPVFTYEWLRTSRRWQLYAMRSLCVAVLGAGLFYVWLVKLAGRPLTIRDVAATGEYFFYAIVSTQLALVLLVAPAYTAGAICLDRARGTLAHLLVTDLSDAELILGKLAARLVAIVSLVGCAIPVLFATSLLGGVDPEAALGAILVTLGVAVLGGTMALTLSVWGRKTHEVLLAAYLIVGLSVLAAPMAYALASLSAKLAYAPTWLELTNPFLLAFLPYLRPGAPALGVQATVLGISLALSVALLVLAVLRVRVVTLRQAARPMQTPLRGDVARRRSLLYWLFRPCLDGSPVLWREWYCRRPSRWARLIWGVYWILAVIFSLVAVSADINSGNPGRLTPLVNGLQVPIGLLLLSVVSVTALADERAQGSLEVLLATPLSTKSILWGKWRGVYRTVPRLIILPMLVIAVFSLSTGEWLGVFLLGSMILAYGAAVTSLGLALATWTNRLERALTICVVVFVLVTIGPILHLLLRHSEPSGFVMASPFFGVGQLTHLHARQVLTEQYSDCLRWSAVWTAMYLVAALILYRWTVETFDRRMGRICLRARTASIGDNVWRKQM